LRVFRQYFWKLKPDNLQLEPWHLANEEEQAIREVKDVITEYPGLSIELLAEFSRRWWAHLEAAKERR
jgi:hypothetical protein